MSEPFPNTDPFADERLSAYLDGELSPGERADVESMLESDPSLKAELADLEGVRSFLMDAGPVSAPADFLDGVLAAVDDEPVVQLAWYRRPFGVPLSGLAVAAAALLVIYVALPGRGVPESERPGADRTGAGAANVKPMSKELPPTKEGYNDYARGLDSVPDSAKEAAEEVKSVAKSWTPDAKNSDDGVAAIDASSVEAGVNETLKVPAKGEGAASKIGTSKESVATEKEAASAGTDEEAATAFSRVPYSYTVFTEDAEALLRLASMAAKHRGEVTEANNQPLQIEQLSGADAATVLVKIPAHALQEFGRELGALGKVRSIADNTVFAGDPVEVRVTVKLSGGAPSPNSGGSNAARKRPSGDDVSQSL